MIDIEKLKFCTHKNKQSVDHVCNPDKPKMIPICYWCPDCGALFFISWSSPSYLISND